MDFKKELNEKQYEAVTSTCQNLRIIAGAGSGKTRVLTYRIAYLISEMKVNPYNILAITFTNKVAKEMKERTANLLLDYDLRYLEISTFHSFCAKFLRREIEVLDFTNNFVIFDEEDQTNLIKNIAQSYGYKKTDDIVDEAKSFIGYHKTYNELPSDIVVEKLPYEKRKLYNFFVEYEKRKAEMKALDFDDLLIYTIKILQQFSDVRSKYQNRFKHILIDEFQDTNDTQYLLLKYLLRSDTSLYVVGDPDQTIYTWRGANQNIILDLVNDFSNLETIILNENYRSTSSILNSANNLISFNKKRVKKDLYTNNDQGDKVLLKSFENSIEEGMYIARQIIEIKKKNPNLSYKDFAILYRSSYLSLKVENALIAYRIPYKVYGGLKFYSRSEIKDSLAYLRLFFNEDDDVAFERIINKPRRGIGETSLMTLKVEANKEGLSMIEYIKNIHHYETNLKAKVITILNDLIDSIREYKKRLDLNLEIGSDIFDEFLTKIGYKDFLESKDETKDKVENIKALIDDIRAFIKRNPESSLLEYLQNVTLITSQDEINEEDNVSLMTVHTAKGLEFNYVFIISFNENIFPNQRALLERNEDGIEEERRLAYVAFTRAKKKLFVTMNREYNYRNGTNNIPSRFIKEANITPDFVEVKKKEEKTNIYRFDFKDSFNLKNRSSQNSHIIDLSKSNNIVWNDGDDCHHEVFGDGKVIKVDGEYLLIDFVDFGVKTILARHPRLSKKE